MKNKIKKISFLFLILGLILIIGGGTYAFFNYTEYSNELVTKNGEVMMKMFSDTNNITLNNVFPETYEEAVWDEENNEFRTDNVIEFAVMGYNEYKNDVYYEIDLEYGSNVNNKTRIDDKYLRFTLLDITYENEDEIYPIFEEESYNSINGKKIFVDRISEDDEDYLRIYRLIMWYDENIIISDTDPNADFRASDLSNDKGNGDLPIYSDLYASVKVKVYGDFQPKKLYDETPASCFEYSKNSEFLLSGKNEKVIPKLLSSPKSLELEEDDYIIISSYDTSCGANLVFPEYIDNLPVRELYMHGLFSRYDVEFIYISKYIENMYYEIYNDYDKNPHLERIEVDPENTLYDSRMNCNAIIETETNTLLVGCINTIIPNTVNRIGSNAFRGVALTSIDIPNNITRIESGAFYHCDNLGDIYVHWYDLSNVYVCMTTSSYSYEAIDNYHIENGVSVKTRLHVPYVTVSMYSSNSNWKRFNIVS